MLAEKTIMWLPGEMFVSLPAELVFSIFVQQDWAVLGSAGAPDYPMSLTKPGWLRTMCSQAGVFTAVIS